MLGPDFCRADRRPLIELSLAVLTLTYDRCYQSSDDAEIGGL